MKLYLHVGTEKTGSSYLQYLIYINREVLRKQYGIYVPANKMQDKRMRKGMISGGNGTLLKKYLQENNLEKLNSFLDSIIEHAISSDCKSIILSNENIFEHLTDENIVVFCDLLRSKKIQPQYLLVLREPVSHIISLYKHRNKYGKFSSIDEWISDSYNTHKQIGIFVGCIKKYSSIGNIKIVKYSNTGGDLLQSFFEDWMQVGLTNINLEDRPVNISLNLAELKVINILSKNKDVIGIHLNNELSKVANIEKCDVPPGIENETKLKVYEYIIDNYHSFKAYIALFYDKTDEQLSKYKYEHKLLAEKSNTLDESITLSISQLKAIGQVINNVSTPYLHAKKFSKKLASLLPQKLTQIYKYYRL